MRIKREQRNGACSKTEQWMAIMRRGVTKSVFCLAVVVTLTGCVGRVRHPNYYTLNLPAPPDPPAAENVHATLAIREFRAPPTCVREQLFIKHLRNRSASMPTTAGRRTRVIW